MDFREKCFILFLFLISTSSIYLIYLTISTQLLNGYKIRFINFIIQHIYSMIMLVKRKFMYNMEDTWEHLLWLMKFTFINFAAFFGVEIYCILHEKSIMYEPIRQKLELISFSLFIYFHIYFQFNIYLGVFSLFSFAMIILYYINQRKRNE